MDEHQKGGAYPLPESPPPLMQVDWFEDVESAVGLGDQGTGLLVGQHWGHLPVQALGPFRSMLIASIRAIGLHKNPTLDRAGSMQSLPGFARRKGCAVCQEFLGGNLMITGLEGPVH